MAPDDADGQIDPPPPYTQFASLSFRNPFSCSSTSPPSLASSLVQDTGPTGPGQSISTLGSEVAVTLSSRDDDSTPASPTPPKCEGFSSLEEIPRADRSSDAGAAIQSWRETVRQASFDGGVDILRGNPRTPGLTPMPMPIVDSPASITRSVSIQGSVRSNRSYEEPDQEWNAETLFEMTNVVREAMKYLRIPNAECEALANILKYMLIDEQTPTEVSLKLISYCRLDKLLEDFHSFRNRMIKENRENEIGQRFYEVLCRASSLEYKWQQRFKTAYFTLDSERIKDMMENGSLQDLVLNPMFKKGLDIWKVNSNKGFADKEGDLGFHAGKWWLNIQCAFRDGIVGRVDEKATKGKCGVTALPLLTGEEMDGPTLNMTQYTKRGKESEMPFGLLGNRGHQIRVLRGHTLKSRYAPEGGVRYDGMYVVKQFSHKLVDEKEDIFQCKLILERVTGQGSINEVLLGPSASEMDEWTLYLQIVSDHIKGCEGIVACSDWRTEHDKKIKEKQKWCKEVVLEAGLQKYVVVPRKARSGQE